MSLYEFCGPQNGYPQFIVQFQGFDLSKSNRKKKKEDYTPNNRKKKKEDLYTQHLLHVNAANVR